MKCLNFGPAGARRHFVARVPGGFRRVPLWHAMHNLCSRLGVAPLCLRVPDGYGGFLTLHICAVPGVKGNSTGSAIVCRQLPQAPPPHTYTSCQASQENQRCVSLRFLCSSVGFANGILTGSAEPSLYRLLRLCPSFLQRPSPEKYSLNWKTPGQAFSSYK